MPVYMRKSVLKCKFSSFYACSTIKIGHHKVEFFTWIKTKSDIGGSKKREIIGCHLWIAPNQDFSFDPNIFLFMLTKISFTLYMNFVAQLIKRRMHDLLLNVGVGSNPTCEIFWRFFFVIGKKGWAHPKVFRLPHPWMTKFLAFKKLGCRKGLK